jgi:hypothetical protein
MLPNWVGCGFYAYVFGQVSLEHLGRQLAIGVELIRETKDCLSDINNSDRPAVGSRVVYNEMA